MVDGADRVVTRDNLMSKGEDRNEQLSLSDEQGRRQTMNMCWN